MSNFVKSLQTIKEDKMFSELHVFRKFVNEHDELCLAGSLFTEPMLFWSVKCLEIPEATTCASTLQRTQVREIGR